MRKITGNILILAVFIMTFWFSSMEREASAGQSTGLLVRSGIISQEEIGSRKHETASTVIRKGAHFSLYFIAGVGAFLSTGSMRRSILIVAVMGGIDEFHQYFVPGRGAQVSDVVLDTLGGTTGAMAVRTMDRLLPRRKERELQRV